MSRALGISRLRAPVCQASSRPMPKPVAWCMGKAQTIAGCSPGGTRRKAGPYQAAACSALATRLRCSRTAPLLTPVVPPLYCSTAMSSGPSCGSAQASDRPRATASTKPTAPASSKGGTTRRMRRATWLASVPRSRPSMSPVAATTMVRTGTCGSTCCSVLAKFSSTTMPRAPQSRSWWPRSRGVCSGFTRTTTMPARRIAATATAYCGRLGIMTATRSPRARPWPCSHAASARDRWSMRSKLTSRPMKRHAGSGACRSKLASISSTKDRCDSGSTSAGTSAG